ncbi:MAG TPA: hypothetical protein PJ991_12330, partial [Kiritimatiellia bacterium]|nr:hypothetical protein [Kiritimatiellia bacterium]
IASLQINELRNDFQISRNSGNKLLEKKTPKAYRLMLGNLPILPSIGIYAVSEVPPPGGIGCGVLGFFLFTCFRRGISIS